MITKFFHTLALFLMLSQPVWADLSGRIAEEGFMTSAEEHFGTLYDGEIETELLLQKQFRDNSEIRILRLSAGLYVMRFSSIYMEQDVDGRTFCLPLFSGGETRNQLVAGKINKAFILGTGDLRVEILVDDTTGFQDAPDYTEYTTRTLYAYIIGFDKEGVAFLKEGEIPVMEMRLVNGVPEKEFLGQKEY